jgi:uncharacterized protein
MLFNVSQLLREHVGATRQYTIEPEGPVLGGDVELVRTPTGVLVRGKFRVVLQAECSRCLAPFSYERPVEFEEVFYQQIDATTGAPVETEAEEDSFLISRQHTIDISDTVRQYGEMAADMQPLCRPDCPGICAECGRDLSVSECDCTRAPLDSRWAALEALKQR